MNNTNKKGIEECRHGNKMGNCGNCELEVGEQKRIENWEKEKLAEKLHEVFDKRKCLNCGFPLREIKDKIAGKKTGHIFTCECMPKGRIISVG